MRQESEIHVRREERMRRINSYLVLILFLMIDTPVKSQIVKMIDAGKLRGRVLENAHQSESMSGIHGDQGVVRYDFDGAVLPNKLFSRFTIRCAGTHIGVRNWTDEKGVFNPAWTAGANYGISGTPSEVPQIMFAVPDKNGVVVHKYVRYQPPSISVDGHYYNAPFPYDETEEVAPEKIPGTADQMVESYCRTWIGLDLHQRVLAWSQKNHDDYILYEYTFKNSGNINLDDAIELPNQILDSLYIMRTDQAVPAEISDREKEWVTWIGCRPGEDLRMTYTYPSRQQGSTADNLGMPRNDYNQPRLIATQYVGDATLFISKAPNDFVNDNPASPQMHTIWDARLAYIKEDEKLHPNEQVLALNVMKRGIVTAESGDQSYVKPPYMTDAYPGTFHEIPPDSQYNAITDINPWGQYARFHELPMVSHGPFRLAPGDSIKFAFAHVVGSISKRKAFDIGRSWYSGTCTPPPGCNWSNGSPTDNLPGQYHRNPLLYRDASKGAAGDYNNWAKDCWIATGRDSLMQNSRAAQWAVLHNYNVPTAPPPPSVDVTGRSDAIRISWGTESEVAPDFAGYRVYRAIGSYADSEWVKIFECNGKQTHYYDDKIAVRGTAYYYYVTAFDDGVSNLPDWNGKRESLESGMYANMTLFPANLARPFVEGALDSIRVVPNPYSLTAGRNGLQFTAEENKIMFYGLPSECTIRIFSENGDLIKTLHHSGSGDESWGRIKVPFDMQTSDSGMRPVSGIYIANITTPDGRAKNVKFLIVR
jgi:hypothetical protein